MKPWWSRGQRLILYFGLEGSAFNNIDRPIPVNKLGKRAGQAHEGKTVQLSVFSRGELNRTVNRSRDWSRRNTEPASYAVFGSQCIDLRTTLLTKRSNAVVRWKTSRRSSFRSPNISR